MHVYPFFFLEYMNLQPISSSMKAISKSSISIGKFSYLQDDNIMLSPWNHSCTLRYMNTWQTNIYNSYGHARQYKVSHPLSPGLAPLPIKFIQWCVLQIHNYFFLHKKKKLLRLLFLWEVWFFPWYHLFQKVHSVFIGMKRQTYDLQYLRGTSSPLQLCIGTGM